MALFQTSGNTAHETTPAAPAPATAEAGLPPHLQAALSRLTEISSLPEITTRIVQVVEDPKSTADDMHGIVKHDPALAAKILKVVNSAFYGLPAQIASLDRAIIMLGLSAVKNIALAASLSRLFRPGSISEHFTARDLWLHCIGVGVCARMLTKPSHVPPEEAFVGGLVHDMGLLVVYQLFPEKLKIIVDECIDSTEPYWAVERRVLGADHQAFGAAIAGKWKFPPSLRSAIAYHHDPEVLKPEYRRLVTTIYVADTICCAGQIGFWLTSKTQTVTDEMLATIGVTSKRVEQVFEELPERIEETERIFAD